jgi:hypothetical protein
MSLWQVPAQFLDKNLMPELKYPVKVVAKLTSLRTFKIENHHRPIGMSAASLDRRARRYPRNLG